MSKSDKRYIPYFHGLTPELLRPVKNSERIPDWLPKNAVLVPRASHALYLSWQAMGLKRGDRFLCPAYTCNTVSKPLQKAGGRPVFFNVLRDMRIDWGHLESLVKKPNRPRALVWYHYLGIPVELDRVREFCLANDLFFIEDCAHALFSEHKGRPVGSFGDVAVFSIRKTLPVLHAGALVVNRPGLRRKICIPWKKSTATQRAYLKDKEAYLQRLYLQSVDRRVEVERPYYREALNRMGKYYGNPAVFWPIDPVSWQVMLNADPDEVSRARRRNYRAYLRELKDITLIPRLPVGASPMGFPVVLKKRDTVRDTLHQAGVESVTHWWEPLMPRGVPGRFGDAVWLASSELTLPCHQDLSVEDVRYVCACVRALV